MEGARGSSAGATQNGPPPEPIPALFLDPIPDILANRTKIWLCASPTSSKSQLFCKIRIFRNTGGTLSQSGPRRAKSTLRRTLIFAVHVSRGELEKCLFVTTSLFQKYTVFGGVLHDSCSRARTQRCLGRKRKRGSPRKCNKSQNRGFLSAMRTAPSSKIRCKSRSQLGDEWKKASVLGSSGVQGWPGHIPLPAGQEGPEREPKSGGVSSGFPLGPQDRLRKRPRAPSILLRQRYEPSAARDDSSPAGVPWDSPEWENPVRD